MMTHVTPTADLPTNKPPHVMNAMPARSPRPPARNMTGIYLGNEANQEGGRDRRVIPPLARGRGVPRRPRTPTEQRRYTSTMMLAPSSIHPADVSYAADDDDDNLGHLLYYAATSSGYFTYQSYLTQCLGGEGMSEPNAIARLPPMPQSRYPLIPPQRRVELLRIKEERRGFSGQPVKRRPGTNSSPSPDPAPHTPHQGRELITPTLQMNSPEHRAIFEITRQTPRNFTPTTNAGLARLEYLSPEESGCNDKDAFDVDAVAKEVQRLAVNRKELIGIIECYRKICKGNMETLQSLLPSKPVLDATKQPLYKYTGFAVKSYRNPNQAEIIADFPTNEARTRTAVERTVYQRPFVPSPYFFKSYNPPMTPGRYRTSQSYSPFPEGDLEASGGHGSAPGSNTSRGLGLLGRGQQTTAASGPGELRTRGINTAASKRSGVPGPRNTPASAPGYGAFSDPSEYADSVPPSADTKIQFSLPGVDSQTEAGESTIADLSIADPNISEPAGAEISDLPADITSDAGVGATRHKMASHNQQRRASGFDIVIGLQDESGDLKPVEIDETDEGLKQENFAPPPEPAVSPKRRVSITERVLKNKNTEQQLACITESAESRKRELADLLNEHAQIVQEVETMASTATTPTSSDKENETSHTGDPPTE